MMLGFRAHVFCNQVLVGPGTPRPAQPITSPRDVASFISSAHSKSKKDNDNKSNNNDSGGLILVAFGTSLAFTSWLSRGDFEKLALGFGALAPARVLWNLQEAGLPHGLRLADLPLAENTKVRPPVTVAASSNIMLNVTAVKLESCLKCHAGKQGMGG
jgi:hypothetical protein